MKIGALAQQFDVTVDTIRFYEKQGLLATAPRSGAGYRQYGKADVQRLSFILRAKAIGFSLQQIRELLAIEDNKSAWVCADVKDKVALKIQEIEQQRAELQRLQQALQQLHNACCGGTVSANACSILAALAQAEPV
ncbi:zinc-responsive transcriptional regulator [Alishewanella agri BL06]|jgi:MerR family Zn(II)-responsive transcriptional regulator of zntA|uniref:Zinc-responsive transcriptional regulator n=1 Tax=Alishewanella agri BL06 TaxID=1195246 RepID=I8U2L6_9ALTE|nr:Zn(2+)-responsive transcriptional regulator [Alishewanella agri]EIW87581.1 zinc-responsive transcriptional regulator [Alishewanella agri BL06]